jgi:hypothetical protein
MVENLRLGSLAEPVLEYKHDMGNDQWLELLRPFAAEVFQPFMADALQELVGGRTTEVLPSLQNIFLAGFDRSGPSSFQEAIGQFVAARQLSGHPIVVAVDRRFPYSF